MGTPGNSCLPPTPGLALPVSTARAAKAQILCEMQIGRPKPVKHHCHSHTGTSQHKTAVSHSSKGFLSSPLTRQGLVRTPEFQLQLCHGFALRPWGGLCPLWGQTQLLNERVGLDGLQGLSVLTLSSPHTVIKHYTPCRRDTVQHPKCGPSPLTPATALRETIRERQRHQF